MNSIDRDVRTLSPPPRWSCWLFGALVALGVAPPAAAQPVQSVASVPRPAAAKEGAAIENACHPKSVGFRGNDGQPIRLAFKAPAAGAILECRTGQRNTIATLPFMPCDGVDGSKPQHIPRLMAEGRHVTEVRNRIGNNASLPLTVSYYVHRSLDNAECCPSAIPDAAWLQAARAKLDASVPFGAKVALDNPFVSLPIGNEKAPPQLLSLRRSFKLSEDRRFVLVTRPTVARGGQARKTSNERSCVGIEIGVPEVKIDARQPLQCPSKQDESPFTARTAGALPPKCPNRFCTVTTCAEQPNGCIVETHVFQRGPGQKPWRVEMWPRCPDEVVASYKLHQCDAYVVNAHGVGACMTRKGTQPVVAAIIGNKTDALGLKVLRPQRGGPEHFTFSAKTVRPGIDGVMYLPP